MQLSPTDYSQDESFIIFVCPTLSDLFFFLIFFFNIEIVEILNL